MFAKWLAEELESKLKEHKRVLFLDPDKEYDFALSELEGKLDSGMVKAEHPFKAKYLAEKEHQDEPCVIYVNSSQDELNYLAEYEATGGVFDQTVKNFVMEKSGIEDMDVDWLKVAAQESLGKPKKYWDKIKVNGKEGILGGLDRKALHFLTEPADMADSLKEDGIYELFQTGVRETYGVDVPPGNVNGLAKELGTAVLLAGLSSEILESELGEFSEQQKKDLKDLYEQWMDSAAGREAFEKHVERVGSELDWEELLSEIVPWELDPQHPFGEADKRLQQNYLDDIEENEPGRLEQKDFIYERSSSQAVKALNLPNWRVFTLLVEYLEDREETDLSKIDDLESFISSYSEDLWKLDAARRLSSTRLSDEDLEKRVGRLYEQEWKKLSKLWYEYLPESKAGKEYRGVTIREMVKGEKKPAVILADGFRYELAEGLGKKLENFQVELSPGITALPTKTSVGMGVLASSGRFSLTEEFDVRDDETGRLIDSPKARIENLDELLDVEVLERNLSDSPSRAKDGKIPIYYYRDIDEFGESGGQGALSYFSEVVDQLADMIRKLLDAGHSAVYLSSDHGFVFSDPEESEKIPPDKLHPRTSSDRFVAGPNLEEAGGTVKLNPEYIGEGLAFPTGRNVFKTPSAYEFMHGGASPQELIIPRLVVKRESRTQEDKPDVIIDEEEPKSVNNRVFDISVSVETKEQKLFDEKRKVILVVTRENEQVFESSVIELDSGSGSSAKIEVRLPEGSSEGEYTAYVLDAESEDTLDSCKLDYEPLRGDLGL